MPLQLQVSALIAVGVPEIVPVDVSNDKPAGNAGEMDQAVTLQYSNLIHHIISKAQTRREYIFIYGPDHLAVEYQMYQSLVSHHDFYG